MYAGRFVCKCLRVSIPLEQGKESGGKNVNVQIFPEPDWKQWPLEEEAGEINMAVAAFWRDANVNGPTGFLMTVVPQTK